jgi:hypothetical protein
MVRDWGRGVRPRSDSPGLGLGLSLIAALAESVQLGHDSEKHTEVRMTFALNDSASSADSRPGMNAQPTMNDETAGNAQPDMNGRPS